MCDLENMCNSYLVCTDSDPRMQPGGCPISRRVFKKDIHYVDRAERRDLANELAGIRLATWRYREQRDSKPQLGFIIDDGVPPSTLRGDGQQVDLYGYISLAVAAVQSQAEEIAALRAELDVLRARLERRPACAREELEGLPPFVESGRAGGADVSAVPRRPAP